MSTTEFLSGMAPYFTCNMATEHAANLFSGLGFSQIRIHIIIKFTFLVPSVSHFVQEDIHYIIPSLTGATNICGACSPAGHD